VPDSLLPPNATDLERRVESVTARLGAVPVPVDTLFDPYRCPAPLLPWLAWALSVDKWNSAWPESIKREVIAKSVGVHVKKGTVGAVKRALASMGTPLDILQWWQMVPEGPHGTHQMTLWQNDAAPEVVFDGALFADAIDMIETTKRKSQHFALRAGHRSEAGIGLAAVDAHIQRFASETLGLTPDMGGTSAGFSATTHCAPRLKAMTHG
jgi:phage tail P2-like protein